MNTRKAKRRWWQFSIRDLLFCTVIVAVASGWLLERRHSNEEIDSLQAELKVTEIETRELSKKNSSLLKQNHQFARMLMKSKDRLDKMMESLAQSQSAETAQ